MMEGTMDKFFVDYSIERNRDGDRLDVWTVYMRRDGGQTALEICTCELEVKANIIAQSLTQTSANTLLDLLN
jgi:hypothetical protein